jgi:hypothetical protein
MEKHRAAASKSPIRREDRRRDQATVHSNLAGETAVAIPVAAPVATELYRRVLPVAPWMA